MGADERRALRITLLGDVTITLPDGQPAGPWERPVARHLVLMLALAPGHQLPRERVSDTLFPRLAPERAAHALSKALTHARSALHERTTGIAILDANRAMVRISPDVEVLVDVDVRRQALAAATALPASERHTALVALRDAAWDVAPSEPHAEWLDDAREQMRRLHHEVLVACASDADESEAESAWAAVLATDPTDEQAAGELIRRQLASGARDRARRTYERTRKALRDTLQIEPSPELTELIGAGESAVEAPTGRGQLLDRLISVCQSPDRPHAISVVGPAGIGKSVLVRALATTLQARGWQVWQATSAPDDRLVPYAALPSLLRAPLTRRSRLELPLLRAIVARKHVDTPDTVEATRARIAAELVALLDAEADDAPLAVVLDDAHWMDEAQQALVSRLATAPAGRWVVVVVARTDEPHADPPELPLGTPRFDVPPLHVDDMRVVVRNELPDAAPDVVERVAQRSRGNPFFAVELARHRVPTTDGPATIAVPDRIVELLRTRIESCTPEARRLVPLVALAGSEASYDLVLRAAARPDVVGDTETCSRVLDELVDTHLLVTTDHGPRLLHPLLRDAALSTINPIRRGALHGLLADALEQTDADTALVARHRLAAFRPARLVDLAPAAARAGFTAGRHAHDVFADDAAMELLRGALDAFAVVPEDESGELRPWAVDAWATIAEIHLDRNDLTAGREAARVAIALAGTDAERVTAWHALAGADYRQGSFARYGEVLAEAIEALAGDDPVARARLTSDLGWSLHRRGHGAEARALYEEARPVFERAGATAPLIRCLDRLALVLSWDDPAAAVLVADEALATSRAAGDARNEAVVLLHRGEILSRCERHAEVFADLDLAQAWFERTGDDYTVSVCLRVRAQGLDRAGDVAAALRARDAELALLEVIGNHRHMAEAHLHRAALLAASGRHDDAATAAEHALEAARLSGDEDVLAMVEPARDLVRR